MYEYMKTWVAKLMNTRFVNCIANHLLYFAHAKQILFNSLITIGSLSHTEDLDGEVAYMLCGEPQLHALTIGDNGYTCHNVSLIAAINQSQPSFESNDDKAMANAWNNDKGHCTSK